MTLRRLLNERPARRYLTGQVLSLVGDSSMSLACGIWVKDLTGSNGAAGLTYFFFAAPAILAPLAGLLADRVRRRQLLVLANVTGALTLLPLLAVRGPGQVWLVYAVMFLYGCLNIVIAPAQSALLVTLLPQDLLVTANGLLRTVQESLRLVAPIVGALLYSLFGGRAVALFDMVTFLGAAALMLSIRVADPVPERAARSTRFLHHWTGEAGAGLRYLFGQPSLRMVVLAAVVLTSVLGFSESTGFAVVDQGLGRPVAFMGVLQAVAGAGAVLGGLTTAAAVRRLGEVRTASAAFMLFSLGCVLTAVPSVSLVLAGRVLSGGGLTAMAVALLTLLQRAAPEKLQGRVYAGFEVVTTVPQTASIALGTYLIGILDYRLILIVQAAVVVLAALLMLRATGPAPTPEGTGPQSATRPRAETGTARAAG